MHDYNRRRQSPNAKKAKPKIKQSFVITVAVCAVVAVAVAGGLIWLLTPAPLPANSEPVSIVMGEKAPKPSAFFSRVHGEPEYETTVDTDVPGEHTVPILVGKRRYELPLLIVDNVAPVVMVKDVIAATGEDILPDDFLIYVHDDSPTTAAFVGAPPPNDKPGIYDVTVRVTDAFNNSTDVTAWCEVFYLNRDITVERGVETPTDAYDLNDFVQFAPDTKSTSVNINANLPDGFYRRVGEYSVVIVVDRVPHFTAVTVKDTIPPNAIPAADEVLMFKDEKPDSELLYKIAEGFEDDGETITSKFKTKPDTSKKGKQTAVVRVSDCSGNTTDVKVKVNVVEITKPPVINGARDLTVQVGGTAAYKARITVTDELDPDPKLQVDSSAVKINELGVYKITYTATNRGGFKDIVAVNVTVADVATADLHNYVDKKLEELGVFDTDDLVERARLINAYVRPNIVYDSINPFDADDEARFAYYILKNLKGNCIAFQRASEIMLQRAGIETRRIQNDYTRGYGADKNVYIRHSWNLIKIEGKWYHFDATRFKYCPMGYSQVHMFTEDYAKKLNAGRRNVYTDYNYPNQEIPDIANG